MCGGLHRSTCVDWSCSLEYVLITAMNQSFNIDIQGEKNIKLDCEDQKTPSKYASC